MKKKSKNTMLGFLLFFLVTLLTTPMVSANSTKNITEPTVSSFESNKTIIYNQPNTLFRAACKHDWRSSSTSQTTKKFENGVWVEYRTWIRRCIKCGTYYYYDQRIY